jgi:hypothetical protein
MSIFDAIVDVNVPTDTPSIPHYLLPSAAFAAGKTNVFVRRGTYVETEDVVIPDGANLQGELQGSTIIDFEGGAYSVRGTMPNMTPETGGAINVTHGSHTVTGTSTTFSNMQAGWFLSILSCFFEIASIESDTSLTLVHIYRGCSLTDLVYKALPMSSYNSIQNLTIQNSSSVGLLCVAWRRGNIDKMTVENCASNVKQQHCAESYIRVGFFEHSVSGAGLVMDSCDTFTVGMITCQNNVSNGVTVVGSSSNLLMTDVETNLNGSNGVFVNGEVYDGFRIASMSRGNQQNGMLIESSAQEFVDYGCTYDSNGTNGIVSNASHTCVNAATIKYNALNGVEFAGNRCTLTSSNIHDHVTGAVVSGNECQLVSNFITTNASDSLHVTAGVADTIVCACNLTGTGASNFNDEGSNTLTDLLRP